DGDGIVYAVMTVEVKPVQRGPDATGHRTDLKVDPSAAQTIEGGYVFGWVFKRGDGEGDHCITRVFWLRLRTSWNGRGSGGRCRRVYGHFYCTIRTRLIAVRMGCRRRWFQWRDRRCPQRPFLDDFLTNTRNGISVIIFPGIVCIADQVLQNRVFANDDHVGVGKSLSEGLEFDDAAVLLDGNQDILFVAADVGGKRFYPFHFHIAVLIQTE